MSVSSQSTKDIQDMWANNSKLPAGSNAEIDQRIRAIMGRYGWTIEEWHANARRASSLLDRPSRWMAAQAA